MAATNSPFTFRDAIASTICLIDSRAQRYRNLVIAVLAVIFASALWATIQWSVLPLLGLLSFPTLCGIYFCLDTAWVNRWRDHLLHQWQAGQLDIDDLCYALRHMKHLPTKTIDTMLGSLPTRDLIGASTAMTPALRKGLAATLTCIHSCQAALSIAATVGWTVGAASLSAATIAGSGVLCLGVLFVLPVLAAGAMWRTLRFRRWRREVRRLYPGGDELQRFVLVAARLDWESIKEDRRHKLLRSLFSTQKFFERCANPRSAPKTSRDRHTEFP
jgi:hypothetical protein